MRLPNLKYFLSKKAIVRRIPAATLVAGLGIAGFSVYQFFTHYVKDHLQTNLDRHASIHHAAVVMLERDIDDLELQLHNGLGRKDEFKGEFEIFPGRNGLRATHTDIPSNPIEIDPGQGVQAFSDSLNLDSHVSFFVFNRDGTLLSALGSLAKNEELPFALSAKVREFSKEDKMAISKKVANANKSESAAMIDVLSVNISNAAGVRFQKQDPSSIVQALSPYKVFAWKTTSIAKSNLVLVSLSRVSESMGTLFWMTLPLILGSLLSLAAFVFAWKQWNARRKAVLPWLRTTLDGIRFGRYEVSDRPTDLTGLDQELVRELELQFSNQSPFSSFFRGKWIDSSRHLATWAYFRETLGLWGIHKGSKSEGLSGSNWCVARLRVTRQQTLESAMRILSRSFVGQSFLFNHFNDNELWFAVRSDFFDTWFEKVHESLRALADYENLKVGDFIFTGCFVSSSKKVDAAFFIETFSKLPNPAVKPEAIAGLSSPLAEFWDWNDLSKPVVQLSWLQLLALNPDNVRQLTLIEDARIDKPKSGSRVESLADSLRSRPEVFPVLKAKQSIAPLKGFGTAMETPEPPSRLLPRPPTPPKSPGAIVRRPKINL